jgi:hypothetical protein
MSIVRPADTSADADEVQFELLRKATPARRATLARSLSSMAIWLSRRALRERMPGASEREVELAWVRLHYGEEIEAGLRRYLGSAP